MYINKVLILSSLASNYEVVQFTEVANGPLSSKAMIPVFF